MRNRENKGNSPAPIAAAYLPSVANMRAEENRTLRGRIKSLRLTTRLTAGSRALQLDAPMPGVCRVPHSCQIRRPQADVGIEQRFPAGFLSSCLSVTPGLLSQPSLSDGLCRTLAAPSVGCQAGTSFSGNSDVLRFGSWKYRSGDRFLSGAPITAVSAVARTDAFC